MSEWQAFMLAFHLRRCLLKTLVMNVQCKILRPIRRLTWALIVAFMVGVHNFYKQEMDSPDSIVNSIEVDAPQDDSAPKV